MKTKDNEQIMKKYKPNISILPPIDRNRINSSS